MERYTAKMNGRGQVVIPKVLLDKLGWVPGINVDFSEDGNRIVLTKRKDGAERVASMRGILKLKYAESVDEFIEDIRGR